MKKNTLNLFFIFIFVFFCLNINVFAATKYVITDSGVYIRKGPGTNYPYYTLSNGNKYNLKSENVIPDEPKNGNCNAGWYQIDYNGSTAYVCASLASVVDPDNYSDDIDRPWTSPKKAIVGGAKYISKAYISQGQFNSYLKKFNVNPNSSYKIYNHQYMANLRAPYSEALTTYNSYKANKLLELPLEFTIPIYNNMPDYTTLPGLATDKTGQKEITDKVFEAALDKEGFPESYKTKLRLLHNLRPNWTFKALKTNLDFNASVKAEKNVSSIQGGNQYYDMSSGYAVSTEPGWYIANDATVSYYLDPRNFLNENSVLMFENLGYSDNYTEEVVKSVLKGTFMDGVSILDNQSYSSIFVEAGKTANISAVYLASLARQESGTSVSRTTSGAQFTYKGITYVGVYNFFNIGAFSSESNPALAGLVWATGGSSSVIVDENGNSGSNTSPSTTDETSILLKLNATKKNNCLKGLSIGTTISEIKKKLNGYSITTNAKDTDIIKTGQVITISDGKNSYTYTITVPGDIDGDGKLSATDYVKIKNHIMEKANSDLNIAQNIAADVDNNGSISAADYVKIKNSIMER